MNDDVPVVPKEGDILFENNKKYIWTIRKEDDSCTIAEWVEAPQYSFGYEYTYGADGMPYG